MQKIQRVDFNSGNSILESTTISLREYLKVIYFWNTGLKSTDILKYVDINKSGLLNLTNKIAMKIKEYLIANTQQFRSPDKIMHIDKT